MEDEKDYKPRNKFALKIFIPLLIICVIAGIWMIKNSQNDVVSENGNNPDFSLNVTEPLDLEQLKSYGLPMIIDFGADSCLPCKEMAPVLNELNAELQGKAIVRFVDVWKYPELSSGYPISVIPTQIFFDSDGNPYTPIDANAIPLNKYSYKETNAHAMTTHEGGITKEQLLNILMEMGLEA